jgi:hypothetical protein
MAQLPPVGHDMKHDLALLHVWWQSPPAQVSEHVEPLSHVYWQSPPSGHVSVQLVVGGQSHWYAMPASAGVHTKPVPWPSGIVTSSVVPASLVPTSIVPTSIALASMLMLASFVPASDDGSELLHDGASAIAKNEARSAQGRFMNRAESTLIRSRSAWHACPVVWDAATRGRLKMRAFCT